MVSQIELWFNILALLSMAMEIYGSLEESFDTSKGRKWQIPSY